MTFELTEPILLIGIGGVGSRLVDKVKKSLHCDCLLISHDKKDLTSENSINNLLSLKYKIQSLDWVHSVITLLDVPLLNNSDKSLQERLNNLVTLKDENVDKERGFKEILDSPVFRNFVISENGKTSGIIVNIKQKPALEDIENNKVKD